MRLLFYISPLTLFTAVLGIEFINPGPFGETGDFTLNAVYVVGSAVNIQWTPGPEADRTSLAMFQLNGTQFLQPLEYLTQNILPNFTSFTWTVQTNKDLTVSNMFYLCIFLEGETSSAANSHYFNITGKNSVKPSSSASTSISSTQHSSPVSTWASTTASAAGSTSTSATAVPTPPPSGMSTGAKAGLGIGISASVILVISTICFIFGRRKKQDVNVQTNSAMQSNFYKQEKSYPQMHQLSGESAVVPTVYELQAPYRQ